MYLPVIKYAYNERSQFVIFVLDDLVVKGVKFISHELNTSNDEYELKENVHLNFR